MKSKIYDIMMWVLLALFVTITSYVAFLTFYPYEPLRIDAFIVDKTEAVRGEKVCFRLIGEKFYPIPVKVSIELIDGENIAIVNYVSNNPVGKGFHPRCFNVPYHVEPKEYKLRWTGVYEMNGFNHVRKTAMSEIIKILPGPKMLRGDKGDVGAKGDKGDKGEKGGVNLFGEGPRGPEGKPGRDLRK
jgi:hypothetical protein